MVQPTKRNVQLSAAFIELANRYEAPEWVSYCLWETLEGTRSKPFAFFEPLTPEELEILRALRDEAGIWFFWQNGRWNPTAIADWRAHAAVTRSEDVLQHLHAQGAR
jgi:hypothetical protein